MNKVGIFNETEVSLNKELKIVKKVLKYALKKEKLKNIEFNVIIVNNERIHTINRDYRNIDKVTDVITFALEDETEVITCSNIRVLGDIYISINRAQEQAIEYNHSFLRELCFLAVHGFYHLLGYDHMTKEEEKIMFAKQEEVLEKYEITR